MVLLIEPLRYQQVGYLLIVNYLDEVGHVESLMSVDGLADLQQVPKNVSLSFREEDRPEGSSQKLVNI